MSGTKSKIFGVSLMALLIFALSSILYLDHNGQLQEAEAFIEVSGRVTTSGGAGVASAKVYFEAPATSGGATANPVARTATTDSAGYYSITNLPSGETYTVDASKFNYERKRHPTTITANTPDVNFVINTQAVKTANFLIAGDQDFRDAYGGGWATIAYSKLVSKQWVYKDNWNVKYAGTAYSSQWNSAGAGFDCGSNLADGGQDTGWAAGQYQGSDILALITKKDLTGVHGCADAPPIGGSGGTHPRFVVEDDASVSDTTTHEVFHNYGFNHHSQPWYCIMQTTFYPHLTTAYPANDLIMALDGTNSNRNWY